jgi:hypothetical protein
MPILPTAPPQAASTLSDVVPQLQQAGLRGIQHALIGPASAPAGLLLVARRGPASEPVAGWCAAPAAPSDCSTNVLFLRRKRLRLPCDLPAPGKSPRDVMQRTFRNTYTQSSSSASLRGSQPPLLAYNQLIEKRARRRCHPQHRAEVLLRTAACGMLQHVRAAEVRLVCNVLSQLQSAESPYAAVQAVLKVRACTCADAHVRACMRARVCARVRVCVGVQCVHTRIRTAMVVVLEACAHERPVVPAYRLCARSRMSP